VKFTPGKELNDAVAGHKGKAPVKAGAKTTKK
jgi:hypothetical protein